MASTSISTILPAAPAIAAAAFTDIHNNRHPMVSSNIVSIGYDEQSCVLEIEFKSGGVYRYADVPRGEYWLFRAAKSHGRHFAAHIKNKFPCQRIALSPALAGELT